MRLSSAQLEKFQATPVDNAHNIVARRVKRLEDILLSAPQEEDPKAEEQTIIDRIDRLEELMVSMLSKKTTSYEFNVTRNLNGSIDKITATPVKGK